MPLGKWMSFCCKRLGMLRTCSIVSQCAGTGVKGTTPIGPTTRGSISFSYVLFSCMKYSNILARSEGDMGVERRSGKVTHTQCSRAYWAGQMLLTAQSNHQRVSLPDRNFTMGSGTFHWRLHLTEMIRYAAWLHYFFATIQAPSIIIIVVSAIMNNNYDGISTPHFLEKQISSVHLWHNTGCELNEVFTTWDKISPTEECLIAICKDQLARV